MQAITKTQKIPLKTNTGKSKQTSSVTIEEEDNKDVLPVAYVCSITAHPLEKPKFPNLVISNAEVDSDDEDVYLSFEERAENYYQHQLKEEFQRESGITMWR